MDNDPLEQIAGKSIKRGQPVVVSTETGKLEAAGLTTNTVVIGIAARDIAPGELVQYRHGGNTKDIITKIGFDNPITL